MWRIYRALYLLSWRLIEINVEHENGFIFLINTMIVAVILNFLDLIFFFFAYRIVGFLRGVGYIASSEMKAKHWWIRLAFAVTCLLLSFISVFSIFRPIINIAGEATFNFIVEKIQSLSTDITNSIIDSFQVLP